MPAKLITNIKNLDIRVVSHTIIQIVKDFNEYLQNIDASETYPNGLLKVLIRYENKRGSKSVQTAYTKNTVFQPIVKHLVDKT
jgi:hypothetical protein